MDLNIKGKTALVTAATRGLGLGCARALANEGVRVAICSRNLDEAESVATRLSNESGSEVVAFQADMQSAEEIQKLHTDVMREFGQLDILIANAGGPPSGTFKSTELSEYEKAFQLTLISAARLAHLFSDQMQARRWGRILFITSIVCKQPFSNMLLSNVMRAGVTGLMKTMAAELANIGVTVNAILPGIHDTDRIQKLSHAMASQQSISAAEARRQFSENVPMGRMGDPDDFGSIAAFLCSQQASFVTGTQVLVDGGQYAGY